MKTRFWLLGLAFPILAACSVTEGGRDGDEARRPLGKADNVGQCQTEDQDFCGEKSEGHCWCDSKCAEYGDCCADVEDACGTDPGVTDPPTNECSFNEDGTSTGCEEGEVCAPGVCLHFCLVGDPGCCAPNTCITLEPTSCESVGGECMSSPIDVTFPADCESDFQFKTIEDASCPAINQACCLPLEPPPPPECQPVLCALFCEHGFATDDQGCEVCSCNPPPGDFCGGIAGLPCPEGEKCILDGSFPDAGGHCEPASCEGHCGGVVGNKTCFCDDQCESFEDCCDDYKDTCEA